jgi:hypothetical protein
VTRDGLVVRTARLPTVRLASAKGPTAATVTPPQTFIGHWQATRADYLVVMYRHEALRGRTGSCAAIYHQVRVYEVEAEL